MPVTMITKQCIATSNIIYVAIFLKETGCYFIIKFIIITNFRLKYFKFEFTINYFNEQNRKEMYEITVVSFTAILNNWGFM